MTAETEKEKSEAPPLGTLHLQDATLSAVREASASVVTDQLLRDTGPFAEMQRAAERGVLDDLRREFIAKKAAGVTFEAGVVMKLQDGAERYGLGIKAHLSAQSNAADVDIRVVVRGITYDLQLKVGSERYIRASVRQRADGVVLLVPSDQTHAGGEGAIALEEVEFTAPTKEEVLESARQHLKRIEAGVDVGGLRDAAAAAARNGLSSALIAGIVDLASQLLLERREQSVDWRRVGAAMMRAGATSAVSTFLAVADAASVVVGQRAFDAAPLLRNGRLIATAAPYIIDVAAEYSAKVDGHITSEEFTRRLCGHGGAALAEVSLFPMVARFASRFGWFGQMLILLAAGMLIRKGGRWLGEQGHDVIGAVVAPASTVPQQPSTLRRPPTPAATTLLPARVGVIATRVAALAPGAVEAANASSAMSSESPWVIALQVVQATLAAIEVRQREALQARSAPVPPSTLSARSGAKPCSHVGCTRPARARRMCTTHYGQWWREQRRLEMATTR